MDKKYWKEISINTSVIVSELLSEFLIEKGSEGVFLINDIEDEADSVLVKSYVSEESTDIDDLLIEIKNKMDEFALSGLDTGSAEITFITVAEEDWANDWKENFDTFRVGKNLVVKPVWQDYLPQNNNEVVINFDPGGFFGSTPHPSTRLCMEELEEISGELDRNANILDLGTGSGILSLVLYLLGLKKITAIDIDPIAISTSKENFKLNNMDIKLFLGELKDCNETYDLVAGNLLAETIEELSEEIGQKLNKGGIFIGAGITREKEKDVEAKLEESGIHITKKKYIDEWVLINAVKQ